MRCASICIMCTVVYVCFVYVCITVMCTAVYVHVHVVYSTIACVSAYTCTAVFECSSGASKGSGRIRSGQWLVK